VNLEQTPPPSITERQMVQRLSGEPGTNTAAISHRTTNGSETEW